MATEKMYVSGFRKHETAAAAVLPSEALNSVSGGSGSNTNLQKKKMSQESTVTAEIQQLEDRVRITVTTTEVPHEPAAHPWVHSETDLLRRLKDKNDERADAVFRLYDVSRELCTLWSLASEQASALCRLKFYTPDIKQDEREMEYLAELYELAQRVNYTRDRLCDDDDGMSEDLITTHRWFIVHYRRLIGELPPTASVASTYDSHALRHVPEPRYGIIISGPSASDFSATPNTDAAVAGYVSIRKMEEDK